MEKKFGIILVLALAFLALGGLMAVAEEAETQTDATAIEPVEADGDVPVSIGGMTVFIDRETGALRQPTAEEAAILAKEMRKMFGLGTRVAATPKQFASKGGGVAVDLGLSQLDYSVATVNADGQISFSCLDSANDAKDHVHNQVDSPEEK